MTANAPTGRPDVDLRSLIEAGPINQGPRPLCLPISLSAAHDASIPHLGKAPEAIWWHCCRAGLVSAAGMHVADAADALALVGQPDLHLWPYNPLLGVGTEDPPNGVGAHPWTTATVTSLPLVHDGREDPLEDALQAGLPVVLAVEVTDEFENPAPDGTIHVPDLRAPAGDYHAVVVVGAATLERAGRCLLIRNSWGPGWGAGGYGWLPLRYLIANALLAVVVTATPSLKN